MFITALFIISRTWEQARCKSADKWLESMWYLHTKFYSDIKTKVKVKAGSN